MRILSGDGTARSESDAHAGASAIVVYARTTGSSARPATRMESPGPPRDLANLKLLQAQI